MNAEVIAIIKMFQLWLEDHGYVVATVTNIYVEFYLNDKLMRVEALPRVEDNGKLTANLFGTFGLDVFDPTFEKFKKLLEA